MSRRRLNPAVEGAAEMLRSGARLGWAMSLLGAQGLTRAMGGRGDLSATLDRLSAAAEQELGPASREMLRSGRRLQDRTARFGMNRPAAGEETARDQTILDQTVQLWTGLRGPWARRLGGALMEGGAGGARRVLSLMSPALGSSSLERGADLLFAAENFAATALEPLTEKSGANGDSGGAYEQVRREARRLLTLDAHSGLWRLEGLGHAYGETLDRHGTRRGKAPHGDARDGEAREGEARDGEARNVETRAGNDEKRVGSDEALLDIEGLPAAARMPLMTGAGLSLARRFLRRGADAGPSARRQAELCRRWAPSGSRLMVFEATGFVAHQLMPLSFEELAQGAESLGEQARAAFYHGAGRALYLSLRSLFDARHPLDRALALADGTARHNAVAGVVWAATLVHLRHPEHIEGLLESAGFSPAPVARIARLRGADADAVDHGLAGALTVWMNHVKDRWPEPLGEPYLAALRDRGQPLLRRAVERARRRIDELEDGRSTWDDVYLFLPGEPKEANTEEFRP